MKNNDLEIIKKYFGEDMSKLCRKLFPTILEIPGKLSSILLARFYPDRNLYRNIIDSHRERYFKDYVYSLFDTNKTLVKTDKSVRELLSEAGYDFYECKTEDQIQGFRKYYAKGEEICTLDGGRLNSCYVFFAVKKNVRRINRIDFPYPNRQDEYGTSVISIQFSKGELNTLSIKNRYNHLVDNPDATFGNNLDNIIPGLTDAFIREYHFNIIPDNLKRFEIPNYIYVDTKNKYYRYNYIINHNVYTPFNKFIDVNGKVTTFDQSRYLLMDYYLIDFHDKTIRLLDEKIGDDFPNQFKDITKIENINTSEGKKIVISMKDKEDVIITLDKNNKITSIINPNIKFIGNNFMKYNKVLTKIELSNLKSVENDFLYNNQNISEISFPKLMLVGNNFLKLNEIINKMHLPNLMHVGDYFLYDNMNLTLLDLPFLEKTGKCFLFKNKIITSLLLPRLREVGDNFLSYNNELTTLNLSSLEKVGNNFISYNNKIRRISLFNLLEVGNNFLERNEELTSIVLPHLKKVGNNFLINNEKITEAKLISLKEAGNDFMYYNQVLRANFCNLMRVGKNFLGCNEELDNLEFPSLTEKGDGFLIANKNRANIIFNYTMRTKILLKNMRNTVLHKVLYR